MIIHIDYICILYVLCDIYIHSFQHSVMLCCGVQMMVDYNITMVVTEPAIFVHNISTLTVMISLVYPFWLLSDGLIIICGHHIT